MTLLIGIIIVFSMPLTPKNLSSISEIWEQADSFEFLFSPDCFDSQQQLVLETGDHPWMVAVEVSNSDQFPFQVVQTGFNYTPPKHRELRSRYRKSYRQTVGVPQDERPPDYIDDHIGRVFARTRNELFSHQLRLLGGFLVSLQTVADKTPSALFVSKSLVSNLRLDAREVALGVDPVRDMPEEERTEDNLRFLQSLKTMGEEEHLVKKSATLVALLLPRPQTTSPQMPKGSKANKPKKLW